MRYLIVIALVLLSACSAARYENAGSQNKFEDDQYDCQVLLGYRGQSRNDDVSQNIADVLVNGPDEMRRCLQRKGWRVVQK